jgi:hypothetical protein
MIVKLSVNTHETQIASVAELRAALSPFASERFREIWVSVDQGPRLAALLNGDVGFLMYLRHFDGDPGFTSRHISFDGSLSATIEYHLSNGQRDEYPASWALPEPDVVGALEYFVEHQGARAPSVCWHDDSSR